MYSFIMSLTPDARARDTQTKQIQDNITNTEKHFGEMCQLFAAYARKTARLRDKADLLVREINMYADTETPNLKSGLKHFANQLSQVQDYRQAEVERLEAKVIEPLKGYGAVLKVKRDDLKTTQSARDREAKQMRQLERMRQRNPSDRQIITAIRKVKSTTLANADSTVPLGEKHVEDFQRQPFQNDSDFLDEFSQSQAESELQRATMDATRTTRQLEETIDEFEKQKICDIKKVLGEFVTVEMAFHAKALEVYTSAFQHIQNVDEEGDLEVFRSMLHPPDSLSRLDVVQANSTRRSSLGRTTGSLQAQSSRQQDDDDDDDEEDDEDDEEDLEEVTDEDD